MCVGMCVGVCVGGVCRDVCVCDFMCVSSLAIGWIVHNLQKNTSDTRTLTVVEYLPP